MFVVPCVDDDTTLFPLRMTKKDFNLSSIEKEFHEMCKESSHKRIVKFLRERTQMNIDAYDSYGWTALMKAAYLGRDDIVRVLLSFGATASVATVILKPNEFGDARDRIPAGSALHAACLSHSDGCGDVVATLLAAGISQTVASGISVGQDWTPLHCACYCEEGHERVVSSLLSQQDADVTALDRSGHTALHLCARLGNASVTKCILQSVSEDTAWMGMTNEVVNARDHLNGSTPIHEASCNGHDRVVSLLLKFGSDVNTRVSQDEIEWARAPALDNRCSPLDLAVRGDHHDAILAILKPRTVSSSNLSRALLVAAHSHRNGRMKRLATLNLLFRFGCSNALRTSRDDNMRTPLHHAVASGCYEFVAALMSHGADRNALDTSGSTALHMISMIRDSSRVREIVTDLVAEDGLNVNAKNDRGETALHLTVMSSQLSDKMKTDVIRCLLRLGANLSVQDRQGYSVFDRCRHVGFEFSLEEMEKEEEETEDVGKEEKEQNEKESTKEKELVTRLQKSLEKEKQRSRDLETRFKEAEMEREKLKVALRKTVETNAALSRGESDIVRKYITEILSRAEEDQLSVRHLMAVQASVRSRRAVWSELESNIGNVGAKYGLSDREDGK